MTELTLSPHPAGTNRKQKRLGQTAIEYLMTYGWTLVAVLAVIAAIYIIKSIPDRPIPPECVLSPGFSCDTFILRGNNLTIYFANGFGHTVNITSISGDCSREEDLPIVVENGATEIIYDIICPGVSSSDKQLTGGKIRMIYTYLNDGVVYNHTIQALVTADVE